MSPAVEPRILYDGVDDPCTLSLPSVSLPCPACRAPCAVDPVAVVRDGLDVGWATSPEAARLQDLLLTCLSYEIDEFDRRRVLRGAGRTSPSVLASTCGRCTAELLAVVSSGEVQPARYRLVLDGLIAIGDAAHGAARE